MINLICPMSGAGQRFKDAGYKEPKPLISILGRPMIGWAIENMAIPGYNFIFIVQREHCSKYSLDKYLESETSKYSCTCQVVQIDGLTEGSLCTVLKAKELISDRPCILFNADQYVKNFNSECFIKQMQYTGCDGSILCFENNNPKWSYAKIGRNGYVCRVAEKSVISNLSTVGIYAFNNGLEYIKYAQQMILDKSTVNGEYYNCPIYNYYCNDGKLISIQYTNNMYGIGTPEDKIEFERVFSGKS